MDSTTLGKWHKRNRWLFSSLSKLDFLKILPFQIYLATSFKLWNKTQYFLNLAENKLESLSAYLFAPVFHWNLHDNGLDSIILVHFQIVMDLVNCKNLFRHSFQGTVLLLWLSNFCAKCKNNLQVILIGKKRLFHHSNMQLIFYSSI